MEIDIDQHVAIWQIAHLMGVDQFVRVGGSIFRPLDESVAALIVRNAHKQRAREQFEKASPKKIGQLRALDMLEQQLIEVSVGHGTRLSGATSNAPLRPSRFTLSSLRRCADVIRPSPAPACVPRVLAAGEVAH